MTIYFGCRYVVLNLDVECRMLSAAHAFNYLSFELTTGQTNQNGHVFQAASSIKAKG